MRSHGFARIPVRRQTLATRKLRARLARERQGPDGKWETNQKKKEVRIVKKKCSKLTQSFEAMRCRRLADEAAAMDAAPGLLAQLGRASKASELAKLMPQLGSLAVTPDLLQQCALADALLAAAKRCRRGKHRLVANLLTSWRRICKEEKIKADATVSDATLSAAASDIAGTELLATPPSAFVSPCVPRLLTPARPEKLRPSWKLGNLFATMRSKRAEEETASVEAATELVGELEGCANSLTLRSLLPRLQGLMITPALLGKCPAIVDSLTAAAKRCHKSKDAKPLQKSEKQAVVSLVATLRENQRQQKKRAAPGHGEDPSCEGIAF